MTNSKNTKRALLASVLSVVLCFAMLVGSTFAWFTDSASTGVNKIVAGNLAIDLVDESGNSLEGKTLGWVAYDGREQEAILWEPGCTYNMEPFYIKNNGNLNLKFKFSVSGIQGDAKLLEAIDFTAMADAGWFKFNTGAVSIETEGEFDLFKGFDVDTLFYGTKHFDEYVLEPGQTVGPIVISGHMKEEAGNEYRGLSIDGIAIALVATQATGEEDSFNGVYDADAEYPVVKIADTSAGFAEALAGLNQQGDQNVVINVTQNVENITGIQTADGNSLAVDFGGNTVTVAEGVGSKNTETNGMQLLQGSNVVLKNGTYVPANDNILMLVQNYSDLTLEDVTLDASKHVNCQYVLSNNHGYIVMTGNTNILAASGNVAFDSCKYSSYEIPTVVIDENMTGTIDGKIEMTGGNLIIKGGTFKNTSMDFDTFESYVADGYTATDNGNGVYTVTKAN